LNLQVVSRGRVPSPSGAPHPWKVPFQPPSPSGSLSKASRTRQGDPGMPPVVISHANPEKVSRNELAPL
jgi:hypothetical protein